MADDPWAEFTPVAAAPQPQAGAPAQAADPWSEFTPVQAPAPQGAPALTVTPGPAAAQSTPDQTQSQPGWLDTAKDVAASAATGVEKGAIAAAGAIPAAAQWAQTGVNAGTDWLLSKAGLPVPQQPPAEAGSLHDLATNTGAYLGPGGLTKGVEALAGPMYQPQTRAGQYAQTVGEFVPGAAIGGGSLMTGAVLPGVADEAAGQATQGTPLEPWARAGAAMLAPGLFGLGARTITPFPISPERQAMVDALQGEGVQLSAGQITGSKPLRYMESALTEMPLAGGGAHALDEAQRAQFTSAALQRIGTNGLATPDNLQAARDAISQQFDALGSRNTLQVDPQLHQDLGDAIRSYHANTLGVIPPDKGQQLHNAVSQIVTQPNGQIPGQLYQNTRSALGKAADGSKVSDPVFSQALRDVRDALDDGMGRSVSPADQAAWQQARQQWGNWKVIEKASTGAGENAAQGYISPSQLRNATVTQNRGAYATGQGDFADLARSGEALMKPLPNSGTAGRAQAMDLARMLMPAAGAVLGGAHGGVEAGGMGGLAGAMAPAVMGRLIMSTPVQKYLGNQVIKAPAYNPQAMARLLMAPGILASVQQAPN